MFIFALGGQMHQWVESCKLFDHEKIEKIERGVKICSKRKEWTFAWRQNVVDRAFRMQDKIRMKKEKKWKDECNWNAIELHKKSF